jgi:hypothetical protein
LIFFNKRPQAFLFRRAACQFCGFNDIFANPRLSRVQPQRRNSESLFAHQRVFQGDLDAETSYARRLDVDLNVTVDKSIQFFVSLLFKFYNIDFEHF